MTELEKTIEQYGLEVPADCLQQLDLYCNSLWAYNKKMNLTRHTDYEKFVSRDLVDTLELSKLIPPNQEVLDIGPGGGVPGLVLAILRPDLSIAMAESVGKKANALNEMADCVKVETEIYHCRAEDMLEDFRYDVTTARAVGPLVKICTWLNDCWLNVGRLLAIKGPKWREEKQVAQEAGLLDHVFVNKVAEYATPGTEWNSVILELQSKRLKKN